MATITDIPLPKSERKVVDQAVIRFAGDSGDGMQITGSQFTNTVALYGNDIATFPDFPAEIRSQAGTLAGVSGFQVHFASTEIHTPGDALDALVVMNAAALKTNLKDLQPGGTPVVNSEGGQIAEVTPARQVVWTFAADAYVSIARRYGPDKLHFLTEGTSAR